MIITYPYQGKIPIFYLCHSCWWLHTRVFHHYGLHWCKKSIQFQGRWKETGMAHLLNFHQLQLYLWGEYCIVKYLTSLKFRVQLEGTKVLLTSVRTESILLISVKVSCSGTPAIPIISSICGARVIFFPQKHEGENTWCFVAVPVKREENWEKTEKRMLAMLIIINNCGCWNIVTLIPHIKAKGVSLIGIKAS